MTTARSRWSSGPLGALAMVVVLVASACGAVPASDPAVAPSPTPATSEPPQAVRRGTTAPSQRVTFAPRVVILPGGERAEVVPARTVDGELKVPQNVDYVGWWDGSSFVGDPFGSTVIAGHVDSATEGLGYFARLLAIDEGERISVGDGQHRRDYRVTSVETVTKSALGTSSGALDQRGEHRLVLITCSGTYRPGTGYDSNLVVTAEPAGDPREAGGNK